VRRWPAPVVDRIEEKAAETAEHHQAWGHRKIAAMMKADGVPVSASSVERALRRRKLLLPARYLAERRENARRRKQRFLSPPRRRNRVWQMDFSRFETAAGGWWNICAVVDYATKYCITAPVTGTQAARDAVASLRSAIEVAEELLGRPLLEDCVDPETGELEHLTIVTDNGPAYKSDAFIRAIMARPELEHVRTRHYSPGQNGVVERFYRTLKYEHLYRLEIADAIDLEAEVKAARSIYNDIRPHEAIGLITPASAYLQDPNLFQAESVHKS
jgi:transposase InsO family protein